VESFSNVSFFCAEGCALSFEKLPENGFGAFKDFVCRFFLPYAFLLYLRRVGLRFFEIIV
jgi:hypothetical protein